MSPSVKSLLLVLAAVLASATAAPFSAVREGHASVAGVPLAHVPDQLRFPPGEVGTKIVGGVEVQPPFAYEWITPLKHKTYGQFCAGTLIAPNWVLTAAHCSVLGYPLAQLEISAHRHDLRKTAASEQGADYNIAAIYVHPDYDSWDISNDVALWKLASPVTVASPIWSIDRTGTASTPGLLAKTLGWGAVRENGASSSVLLEVDVPIIDQAVCNADYYVNQIHATHLCAGYPDVGGKDACQGDSGGPLITFDSDSNPVLVGITSWGYGCARRGYPGVYTNVTSVSSWVDATILKHTSF